MRPIQKTLQQYQHSVAADAVRIQYLLASFADKMTEGLKRVPSWHLNSDHFSAVSGGLCKTYNRACKAMRSAYATPSSRSFHEWRKRVKYHWYHMRILNEIWPEAIQAREDALDRLGTLLGDHHDLSLLRNLILNDPGVYAKDSTIIEFAGWVDLRLRQIEDESHPWGKRLFTEKPKQFIQRFEAYWEVSRC